MSPNLISNVLLVSFDDTQVHGVQKLRGVIEEEQSIKVYNFNDIHHEYEREPCYANKLKLLLDGVKLSILVTSHKISDTGMRISHRLFYCLGARSHFFG